MKTTIGLGTVTVRLGFHEDRNARPKQLARGVYVTFPALKINGKAYENASAYREEYDCLVWGEDGSGPPSHAMHWGMVACHCGSGSALTSKAYDKVRAAFSEVFDSLTDLDWARATLEHATQEVQACRATRDDAIAALEAAEEIEIAALLRLEALEVAAEV